jgi:hypothetical protein
MLRLTPEKMAEVWEVYSLNQKNVTELTIHQFEAYRNLVLKFSQVTPATEGIINSTKGAAMVITNKRKRDVNDNYISNMVTPPTAKRHQSGPGEVPSFQNKNMSSSSSIDQVAIQDGSPTIMKKSTVADTIPGSVYTERTNAGQVVLAYPSNRTSTTDRRNTKTGTRCTISSSHEKIGRYNITKPYRHMFTTMEDRAVALEQLLVAQKEAIIENHGLSTTAYSNHNNNSNDSDDNLTGAFAPLEEVNVARQEKVVCIGRICNEVRLQLYLIPIDHTLICRIDNVQNLVLTPSLPLHATPHLSVIDRSTREN